MIWIFLFILFFHLDFSAIMDHDRRLNTLFGERDTLCFYSNKQGNQWNFPLAEHKNTTNNPYHNASLTWPQPTAWYKTLILRTLGW